MPAEAIIRPRRDADLDALAPTLVAVYERDGYPVEGVADPRAWLTLARPLGAWVAELDGQIVGHVALTEPSPGDDAARLWIDQHRGTPDDVAVLGRLFVSPDARGHHLGARLTETATDEAARIGRRAVLDVMLKDAAAIRTYEALGWRPLGDFNHHHSNDAAEPARAYVAPPVYGRPQLSKVSTGMLDQG
ncbi:GNAT family N-acetyltransferase [Arsenicicoccus bolidensis]|uniref:GNAT family N-acetyltransferase n=1 Tax=Arsenicicoccus bolidensis TaxID=229480 RepID=A0ABS9PZ59_9MICO|nr:GNAT family N-acetyltransferase [Arsenicicoccus bolidensis]MCG7320814.1 GNAT family N-acetyltransferase [Arsenicicoccus bolidensis]